MKGLNWLKESNRWKHLVWGIPCGFLLTFLFALGVGVGMEFKDKMHGGTWDWLDLAATCIGGAIGQGLMLLLVWAL